MANTRCPHCRTTYKLPDERLQQTLRCKQCGNSFVAAPLNAPPATPVFEERKPASARARRQKRLPLLALGLIGGSALVAFVLLKNQPARELPQNVLDARDSANAAKTAASQPKPPANAPIASQDALQHPAMRRVDFLRKAITNYNYDALALQLDLGAWYAATAEPAAPRWTAVTGAARDSFVQGLTRRLSEDPALRNYAGKELSSASAGSDASGRLQLELRSKDIPGKLWRVSFTSKDEDWQIAAMEVADDLPPAPEPQATAKPQYDSKLFVSLDSGKTENGAEGEGDGSVNLQDEDGEAHLFRGTVHREEMVAGATPEQIKHMDELVTKALANEGRPSILATSELEKLAPAPIPLLLNRLVDLPLSDDPARLDQIAAVDALLQRLSWRQSGFPLPSLTNIEDAAKLRQRRQICLEAWFGWWDLYGGHWDAWKAANHNPEAPPDKRRPAK